MGLLRALAVPKFRKITAESFDYPRCPEAPVTICNISTFFVAAHSDAVRYNCIQIEDLASEKDVRGPQGVIWISNFMFVARVFLLRKGAV